jgi:hypothetical protein
MRARETAHAASAAVRADDYFIRRLNDPSAMDPRNSAAQLGIPERNPTHRLILVCGPPRSGTTLVTQLIAQHFDVGFIDHLTARFYRRPALGAMLRRSVFGDRHVTDYRSDYGRTSNPLDVHAMGWFWQHHLAHRFDEYLSNTRLRLNEILGAWQKPVVMLGHYPQLVLSKMPQDVSIVRVHRNTIETAMSLYRKGAPFGVGAGAGADPNTPFEERCVRQVEYIEGVLESREFLDHPGLKYHLYYRDLMECPANGITELGQRLGLTPRRADEVVKFRPSPRPVDEALFERLAAATRREAP